MGARKKRILKMTPQGFEGEGNGYPQRHKLKFFYLYVKI